MLARVLVPLALSTSILVFGPSAQGELDLSVELPAAETPVRALEPAVSTRAGIDVTHTLLVNRLAALDRDLPGLVQ